MLGEHIRTLKKGRWNHAIDCGDETVIHLAEEGATRTIRRSYRPEFISGAEVVEVVTHRQRTFPSDEVVARAYSRIADPALAAMFATSESFAHWCTTGRPLPPSAPPTSRATTAPRKATGAPARGRAPAARKARPGKSAKATAPRRSRAKAKPRKPRRAAPRRRS